MAVTSFYFAKINDLASVLVTHNIATMHNYMIYIIA